MSSPERGAPCSWWLHTVYCGAAPALGEEKGSCSSALARDTFWAPRSLLFVSLTFPLRLFIIHFAVKPVVSCAGRHDYRRGIEWSFPKCRCFSVSSPQTGHSAKYSLQRLARLMFKGRNLSTVKAQGVGPFHRPEVQDMGQRFWGLQKDGGTPKRHYLKNALQLEGQGAVQ